MKPSPSDIFYQTAVGVHTDHNALVVAYTGDALYFCFAWYGGNPASNARERPNACEWMVPDTYRE